MERNAFLPHEYHALNEHALLAKISELDDVIGCLPDGEVLKSLRQEVEEARQTLFDEFLRRNTEEVPQIQAEAKPSFCLLFPAASFR